MDGEVGVAAAGGAEGAPAAGGGEGGSGRKWHGYGGDGVVVVVEEEEEEDSGMTMVMGWDCGVCGLDAFVGCLFSKKLVLELL